MKKKKQNQDQDNRVLNKLSILIGILSVSVAVTALVANMYLILR